MYSGLNPRVAATGAWTLIDDVSWVIQQLKKNMGSMVSVPQKRVPQKRMHDADTDILSRKT